MIGLGLGVAQVAARGGGEATAPDYVEPTEPDQSLPTGEPDEPTVTPDPDWTEPNRIDIVDASTVVRTTNDPGTFGVSYVSASLVGGEYWEIEVQNGTPKNATFAVGITTLDMPLNGIPGERATEIAWWSDGTIRQGGVTILDLGAAGELVKGDTAGIGRDASGAVFLWKNCVPLNSGSTVGTLAPAEAVYPFVALYSARVRLGFNFTEATFNCPVPTSFYPIGGFAAGPTSARYWRVLITGNENSGADYTRVCGVELYADQKYGRNVAPLSTVTASSKFTAVPDIYGPEQVIDTYYRDNTGTLTTQRYSVWVSAYNNGLPQWLAFDFGAGNDKAIVGMGLVRGLSYNQDVTDYELQYSDDGASWTTLYTVNGDGTAHQQIEKTWWGYAPQPAYTGSPHGSHQNWRVVVMDPELPSAAAAIGELEFRALPGGADQVSGGTASADSIFSGSFPASAAFDNNNASVWSSTDKGDHNPAWISYDFGVGNDVQCGEIAIRARNDVAPNTSPAFMMFQYHDGSTWTTAWSAANQTGWTLGELRAFSDPAYVA